MKSNSRRAGTLLSIRRLVSPKQCVVAGVSRTCDFDFIQVLTLAKAM